MLFLRPLPTARRGAAPREVNVEWDWPLADRINRNERPIFWSLLDYLGRGMRTRGTPSCHYNEGKLKPRRTAVARCEGVHVHARDSSTSVTAPYYAFPKQYVKRSYQKYEKTVTDGGRPPSIWEVAKQPPNQLYPSLKEPISDYGW